MSPEAMGAHSERMTVRVAEMELADAPRFVGRRHRHLQAELDAEVVQRVDLLRCAEEPRHPDASCRLVEGKGRRVCPPRSLTVPAQEDLGGSARDPSEPRLTLAFIPLEGRLPPEQLKPGETFAHVGHIENRSDEMHCHVGPTLVRCAELLAHAAEAHVREIDRVEPMETIEAL